MSIRSTYDRLILGHPRLVVFLTLAVMAFCFYEARFFKLDASSDALLLENDAELRYYSEIKRYFGSDEFLILTFEPNGELFSQPVLAPLKPLYDAYSFQVLPRIGRLVAGDADSYRYLAESIRRHPDQDTLLGMLHQAGFSRCQYFNLAGGIVAVHRGYRL